MFAGLRGVGWSILVVFGLVLTLGCLVCLVGFVVMALISLRVWSSVWVLAGELLVGVVYFGLGGVVLVV